MYVWKLLLFEFDREYTLARGVEPSLKECFRKAKQVVLKEMRKGTLSEDDEIGLLIGREMYYTGSVENFFRQWFRYYW